MSLATYNDLTAAVQAWLIDRTDLVSRIPDFIRMAELRIYRMLRIRAMEMTLNSDIASDGTLALPSDYIELKNAYVNTTPYIELERQTPEYIYKMFPYSGQTGVPMVIARLGENFIFAPYPDSTYTVIGIYYGYLPALSDSNPTNWFMTNAPELLLFGALCEAVPYLHEKDYSDERVVWETKFQTILNDVKMQDKREWRSGSRVIGKAIPRP